MTPNDREQAPGHILLGDYAVYIAPGRFSRANEEKILYIAGLDWENQIDTGDPVANVSLFDGDKDEPLVDREDWKAWRMKHRECYYDVSYQGQRTGR